MQSPTNNNNRPEDDAGPGYHPQHPEHEEISFADDQSDIDPFAMASFGSSATSIPPSSPPLSPHQRSYTPPTTTRKTTTRTEDEEGEEQYDDNNDEHMSALDPLPEHDDDFSGILPPPPPTIHISNDDETTQGDHDDENDDAGDHDDEFSIPNRTMVEEREMHRKLMDVESSFLPEPSAIRVGEGHTGMDDTFLVGVAAEGEEEQEGNLKQLEHGRETPSPSPSRSTTRTDTYQYLGPGPMGQGTGRAQSLFEDDEYAENLEATPSAGGDTSVNTTSLKTISSSPTAAATARTISRALSAATARSEDAEGRTGEHNEAGRSSTHSAAEKDEDREEHDDVEATPRRSRTSQRRSFSLSRSLSSLRRGETTDGDVSEAGHSQATTANTPPNRRRTRPKFLTSRQSSHRYSTSSVNTDTTSSDANIGLDYALQSGGAVPANNELRPPSDSRQKRELLRSTSLGSMASGISGYSDETPLERRGFSGISEPNLHTLDEEDAGTSSRPNSAGKTVQGDNDTVPMTPKAKAIDPPLPTDTVIAQHVQDIHVPSAFSRQFRESNSGLSPDKRGAPTPGFSRGKNMTLKEQSSTIDRLSKENFDLKMRIHFLNEALNKRSEEGVKEMISENVELKSDKLKLQKDNQALRKKMRELENQLRDRGDGEKGEAKDGGVSGSEEERVTMEEEELIYLQERLETYEIEIERLRSESIARESEKRRLAEMVKSLSDGRAVESDAGAREERDMWKDMLDAETAAREQAEDENRRLRDELLRVKGGDVVSTTQSRVSRRRGMSSVMSHSDSDRDALRNSTRGTATANTLVELELLKQENAELRREVSAQTSMLTSRNREKERLYQEIEDLKLQRRFDGRSIAGDSIFERSASRAAQDRSASRASDGTRASRMSDAERESLETKNGELRDQVSTLKLENQGLRAQLDEYQSEIEEIERAYNDDMDQIEEEFQTVQLERDHAMQLAEEREAELQDLKGEAQEEINNLEDELEIKHDEGQRLEAELRNQEENLRALQAEMRSANEGILRLEEDAQNNLHKYKVVQRELEDANRELESLEKNLFESNGKVQRLTVQLESSQNEIAFLREEQDADKIRIGDLESELKTTQINLHSEKDQTRELDRRLAEERHQREVVGGKEKQEVQRIMNELNRENTGARDDIRKLKKALSAREIEANTWKERLFELEGSLREVLGDLNGTKSGLLTSITKLQKELESTTLELQSTREKLDEKEALLRNRDALLESHGLETRKLAELLERERQAHRADKHSFEQALKSHQQASRTIAHGNSRISDLEHARNQERKRFSTLEQQYKDQLNERNAMFLNVWKRLSAMCGPDWAHSNSLINGNLPSQEVIGNMLFWPGFSKNLLLALKTVEHVVSGFKGRVKNVERDLTKAYQNLEHTLSIRLKKLDRLEELAHQMRTQKRPLSSNSTNAEMSKLRGENRLLKAELNLLQSHSRSRGSTAAAAAAHANPRSNRSGSIVSPRGPTTSGIPQPAHPNHHHYSSSSTTLATNTSNTHPSGTVSGPVAVPTPPQPQLQSQSHRTPAASSDRSEEKWIQRLRELERRLKAEREARLLDRSGARKRLEERSAENEQLRQALERERLSNAHVNQSHRSGPGSGGVSVGGFDGAGGDVKSSKSQSQSKAAWNRSNTKQQKPQQQQQQRHASDTGTDDLDGDEKHGEMVLESRGFIGSSQQRQQRRESYQRRRDETIDAYDGEEDEEDEGTGTSDGGGLCVEVEV